MSSGPVDLFTSSPSSNFSMPLVDMSRGGMGGKGLCSMFGI